MAPTLKSRLVVSAVSDLTSALDLAAAKVPLSFTQAIDLASGVGADQADRIFHDHRILAASATEDLDLSGVLTDALGAVLAFARVKVLIVAAAKTNVNNVVVGGAAVNTFVGPFGAATHTSPVRPGGIAFWVAPDVGAWPVVPGTGDLLKVANSGAGTQVDYDIVIIGASA